MDRKPISMPEMYTIMIKHTLYTTMTTFIMGVYDDALVTDRFCYQSLNMINITENWS